MSDSKQLLSSLASNFNQLQADFSTVQRDIKFRSFKRHNALRDAVVKIEDIKKQAIDPAQEANVPEGLYNLASWTVATIEYLTSNDCANFADLEFPSERHEQQTITYLSAAKEVLNTLRDRSPIEADKKLLLDIGSYALVENIYRQAIDTKDARISDSGEITNPLLENDSIISTYFSGLVQHGFAPINIVGLKKLKAMAETGTLSSLDDTTRHFAELILGAFDKHGIDINSTINSKKTYYVTASELMVEGRKIVDAYPQKANYPVALDIASPGFASYLVSTPDNKFGAAEIGEVIRTTGACMARDRINPDILKSLVKARTALEQPGISTEITREDRVKAIDLIETAALELSGRYPDFVKDSAPELGKIYTGFGNGK